VLTAACGTKVVLRNLGDDKMDHKPMMAEHQATRTQGYASSNTKLMILPFTRISYRASVNMEIMSHDAKIALCYPNSNSDLPVLLSKACPSNK
jgi:hypothetical protein